MKKTIQELVDECGLVPSDIVKLSDGRLSIGQASVWLKDFKLSMPAELLLEWYCRRKAEEGVGPLPAGRKKLVAAEIFEPALIAVAMPESIIKQAEPIIEDMQESWRKLQGHVARATTPTEAEFSDQELEEVVPINTPLDRVSPSDVAEASMSANLPPTPDVVRAHIESKPPAKKVVEELKKSIPSLKSASEIPSKKPGIEIARGSGVSYDRDMDMRYKHIADGLIKFCCDGKWWQVSKDMKECYAGARLVRMSELSRV